MTKTRVKKNKKAISTFIATLLLMVLAVSAGVIIYAYVMGYLGGFTGTSQTMGAMSIDSASLITTAMNVYIRNIGHTAIDFDKAYVNGANATFVASPDPVLEGGVALVTITQAFTASKTYEFRLIAKDNTQITFNLKAGGTSGSGGPGTYALTVTPSGSGSVTLDPAGGSYAPGTVVTLTAAPDASTFTAWGGALGGSTSPTTITMDGDKSVTATFKRYYKTATIQASQIPDTTPTLLNFPVLVSRTTDSDLALRSRADGYDIYFTMDPSGNPATKLDHEIETFNEVTGNLVAWVRIPSLSATADTVLYMFYGAQSISTPTENQEGVWNTNYKGVWHLGEGSGTSSYDSTLNNNDGTLTSTTWQTGQVGNALGFNGLATSKLDLGSGTSLSMTNVVTVEGWFNAATINRNGRMFVNGATGNILPYSAYLICQNNALVTFEINNIGLGLNTAGTFTINNWYHIAATYDGTTAKIYLNGVSSSKVQSGTITQPNTHSIIGADLIDSLSFYGKLDEMRVSNTARSADWITTEYNNMSSPSTFISVSLLEYSVPP